MKFSLNSNKDKLSIDIGSLFLRATVESDGNIYNYSVYSSGVEYGVIVNEKEFEESLLSLLQKIITEHKFLPSQVAVSISTAYQNSASLSVGIFVNRQDGVVTETDIENIKNEARSKLSHLKDKIILHELVIKTKLDNILIVGNVVGLIGKKIEAKVLFIYDDYSNYVKLNETFERLGIEIDTIVSGPYTEAEYFLSKKEKRLGTTVVNIGHHLTTISVFENGKPLLCSCVRYGGEQITSDIAVALKIDLDEAETAKKTLNLKDYSKRKCETVIDNSGSEIGSIINQELDRIKRAELLPGGIKLLGGSSKLKRLEEQIKYITRLPALSIYNLSDISEEDALYVKNYSSLNSLDKNTNEYSNIVKKVLEKISSIIKKFLP